MIDGVQSEELKHVISSIADINQTYKSTGQNHTFIQFTGKESENPAVITANKEGLVYLAERLLELAISGAEGKHFHFDEYGALDDCDKPLVIRYKSAEWESPRRHETSN